MTRAATQPGSCASEARIGALCLVAMQVAGSSLLATGQAQASGGADSPELHAAFQGAGWASVAATIVEPRGAAPVGVLLVADTAPREWTADELDALGELGALVGDGIASGGMATPARGQLPWLDDLAGREARVARRRGEERLMMIFNSTSDLTFLVAVEGGETFRFVAVNESFLAVTGLMERDVVGHTPHDFLSASSAERAVARYALTCNSGEPMHYEETFELPVGELLVDVTLTPIAGDSGDCTYLLGVAHDMTRRRRAEAELRAAMEAAEHARAEADAARVEAERASQAKTDFLSRMSHELRTPLNSVIGFANVLRANRGNRLDEREISYLDRIITNGRHLLTIVGDLLDISRVEAGKMPVSMAMVPLAPLVRTTAAAFEADLAGRPVALLLELPQELERIETDATRLQQVLINLIGNAIKFTDGGTITVRVVADPDTARPLRLEVQDTGIGIPLHRQAAIFQAFEQAERGTSSTHGGTGLGLAISRSLCQLLGFHLAVRSAPGEGATFIVDFVPGAAGSVAAAQGDAG